MRFTTPPKVLRQPQASHRSAKRRPKDKIIVKYSTLERPAADPEPLGGSQGTPKRSQTRTRTGRTAQNRPRAARKHKFDDTDAFWDKMCVLQHRQRVSSQPQVSKRRPKGQFYNSFALWSALPPTQSPWESADLGFYIVLRPRPSSDLVFVSDLFRVRPSPDLAVCSVLNTLTPNPEGSLNTSKYAAAVMAQPQESAAAVAASGVLGEQSSVIET